MDGRGARSRHVAKSVNEVTRWLQLLPDGQLFRVCVIFFPSCDREFHKVARLSLLVPQLMPPCVFLLFPLCPASSSFHRLERRHGEHQRALRCSGVSHTREREQRRGRRRRRGRFLGLGAGVPQQAQRAPGRRPEHFHLGRDGAASGLYRLRLRRRGSDQEEKLHPV